MITVLCANAGIDKTYEVEGFEIGGFHHPRRFQTSPGGKGINVARVLRLLGQDVAVTGFLGGSVAPYVQSYLRQARVRPSFAAIAEESRLCINIVDTRRRNQTRVDEVGPLVAPSEVDALRRIWERLAAHSRLMIISGSAPRGVPYDLYADLIESAKSRKIPVLLDAHDEMLRYAIQTAPTVVMPNRSELSVLFEDDLSVPDGVVQASRELIAMGVRVVICSLGGDGAIVVSAEEGEWRAKAAMVEVISTVGCGDAAAAGYAAAWARGLGMVERVRWSMAAGAACAATFGPVPTDANGVAELVPRVQVARLGEPMELFEAADPPDEAG